MFFLSIYPNLGLSGGLSSLFCLALVNNKAHPKHFHANSTYWKQQRTWSRLLPLSSTP